MYCVDKRVRICNHNNEPAIGIARALSMAILCIIFNAY